MFIYIYVCVFIYIRREVDLAKRRALGLPPALFLEHCQLRRERCRANPAHTRQSGPDSGLGLQVKVLETFPVVPS